MAVCRYRECEKDAILWLDEHGVSNGYCNKHYKERQDSLQIRAEQAIEPRNTQKRKSGGSTHYYALPPGATQLHQLIRHKKMGHGIGEAFCSLYRLDDNGERKRNLEKVLFYVQLELDAMTQEDN